MEAIRFDNITKTFGKKVTANKDISFSIEKGLVYSLLGENGSGKTSLMNVLVGIYKQDTGKVFVNGIEAEINSPSDAYKYKIGMIHQHFKLVNVFTATENIVLGLTKKDYALFYKETKEENEKQIAELKAELEKIPDIGEKLKVAISEYKAAKNEENKKISDELKSAKKNYKKEIKGLKHGKKASEEENNKYEEIKDSYKETVARLKYASRQIESNPKVAEKRELINKYNLKNRIKELAREIKLSKRFNLKESARRVASICEKFGFNINPFQRVYDMSVSQRQTLEIVKALYRGVDILILDEPTAVLTPQETKQLFNVLRNMRNLGKTVIIITHKLNEVMEISDKVVFPGNFTVQKIRKGSQDKQYACSDPAAAALHIQKDGDYRNAQRAGNAQLVRKIHSISPFRS